jgi:ppGpp synthetase/RelA/SpoT-type nucleotidyltranferase
MPKKGRKKIPKRTLHQLHDEYRKLEPLATDFGAEVVRQLNELLQQEKISLAVPIEFRVKTWLSIAEKLERKELMITSLDELPDLIGVRAILLFRRDVETVCTVIQKGFTILSREDTIKRLGESQFGYSSMHYIIQIPKGWLSVPSLARFDGLKAELQIRTVAQHLWAATSHVLQYKQEQNVPPPVRRAIYRVSALLETIDLEFERVLIDRENYRQSVGPRSTQETLNVDLLAKVLSNVLPPDNRAATENFAQLLSELFAFGISTPEALTKILTKHKAAVLRMNRARATEELADKTLTPEMTQRVKRGVFFTWVGLVRTSLDIEFGEQWRRFQIAKHALTDELGLAEELPLLLAKIGILFICDLASKTSEELRQYPDVTDAHVAQIEQRLSHYGLTLGMPKDVAAQALANSSVALKRLTTPPRQR